ncbi:metal-dependent hydrolase [Haloarcula salinisoli]|uniref:Metal-dependent hydrolase n=1 Tax=Haloarcula salinisoli TaxID=2487746 RepID=A0A8J7YEX4_9EURY|nr:metal-dependent hydrolase [Halomicroarcula salinisoli]MBX0286453.1 metal-dependent hydrolase [Halomicroarcula salinisoli]MBX0302058.1 metal-dependent hydrolase [Halomicroarcula salinisoli]
MRPPEHLAFALIPLIGYTLVRYRRPPTGYAMLYVVLATQLPDLIDKPLAWTFGIIPSGRMLAHSIVLSGPLLCLGYLLALRRGRGRPAAVFSLAYLSHLVGDFYPILTQGTDYYFFPNLFWPLLEANPDHTPSFAAHFSGDLSSLLVPLVMFSLVMCYIVGDILWRSGTKRADLPSPPL